MPTITKAQRWGGSVAAPIPAGIAKRLHISPGTPIQVEERNGTVCVTPAKRPRRRTLKELLRECKRKFPRGNPHGEISFGPPVGREIW
jgi:antitoxin component of MazEF toxin-antitoxin module